MPHYHFKYLSLLLISLIFWGCFNSPVPLGFKAHPPQPESPKTNPDLLPNIPDTMTYGANDLERIYLKLELPLERVKKVSTRNRNGFDVTKYAIVINLDAPQEKFSGLVNIWLHRVIPGSSDLALDMNTGLKIDGVAIDDAEINDSKYRRTDDGVDIQIAPQILDNFKITLQYHGNGGSRGISFSKRNGQVVQAWTVAEPTDARRWIPSIDQPDMKAPVEQFITVPKQWKVLANGSLRDSVKHPTETQSTYHWVEELPLATYLISFLAGDLDVKEISGARVPVSYWIPHEDVDAALKGFALTPEMIDYYSQNLINYPYEKYAIGVAYDFRGAMEHTSATTFGHDMQSLSGGMDSAVAAHELAHQWFGDTVTCKTWDDIWLNEGFASYFDVLFWEHFEGSSKRLTRLEAYKRRYLSDEWPGGNGSLGPIVNTKTAPEDKFNVVSYEKAALVLNTLRYELGLENFLKALAKYVDEFKFKSASTLDLKHSIETTLGINLDDFFNQWVFSSGIPEISYSWSWDEKKSEVKLTVQQLQKNPVPLFKLGFDLEITYIAPGSRVNHLITKVIIESAKSEFTFSLPTKPKMILLDPQNWVLAVKNANKTEEEWNYVLDYGQSFLVRIAALDALEKTLGIKEIHQILETEKELLVKAAALSKLLFVENLSLVEIEASRYLYAEESELRNEAIKLFGKRKDRSMVPQIIKIFLSDENWRVAMQAAFSLGQIGDHRAVDPLVQELYRQNQRGYINVAVVTALGQIGDKSVIPHLVKLLENPKRRALWVNVVDALVLLKDQSTLEIMGNTLLREHNEQMALKFLDAVVKIGEKEALPILRKLIEITTSDVIKTAAQKAIDSLSKPSR